MVLHGGDRLRQGAGLYTRVAEGHLLYNPMQNLSANKTARAVVSPIQASDLQFAFALA